MIPVPLHTAAVVFENDEDDDALFFFARAESRLLLLFLLLFKEETSKADFNECVEKDIYACVRVCVCVCVCARVCVFERALDDRNVRLACFPLWRRKAASEFGFIHERPEGLFFVIFYFTLSRIILKKMSALNNHYYSFQAPLYFSSLAL
jgi:hypothetical protein